MTTTPHYGTFYGIGVGPGDPELLTLKAERLLRSCPVIAAADSGGTPVALGIVSDYLAGKELLRCPAPMTRDRERLQAAWQEGARLLCGHLTRGRDVAFVTLGDPTIYSTCGYLCRLVRQAGFDAQLVPGIPSFCAAAAAVGESLCEGEEALTILPPANPALPRVLREPGTKVVMKAGRSVERLQTLLEQAGGLENAVLAENCGMEAQRIAPLSQVTSAGYFSTVIIKD